MKKKKVEFNFAFQQSVLKSSEGGPGTSVLKNAFKKRDDVKISFHSSMYVGHTAFTVRTTTMKVMREVGKTLKDYGFIDSIKEMNHYIQEI
jgi:hypothetical protein